MIVDITLKRGQVYWQHKKACFGLKLLCKMDKFEIARQKYKPHKIRYLLVAETPPKSDSQRFFYFEDVDKQDSLFIQTIRVIYSKETENIGTPNLRKDKKYFLDKLKNDGFYLIDSIESPFEIKYSFDQKANLIRTGQYDLLKKISSLIDSETKVILIAKPVYVAIFSFLTENGVNTLNKEFIDFPGSGGQKKYRDKMRQILGLP